MPSDIARAALSAVTEGWEVLVVDPGGPTTVLLPRPAVWALAQQQPWEPAVGPAGVDAEVRDAIVAAVSPVRGVVAVDAVAGTRAEVAVVVDLVPGPRPRRSGRGAGGRQPALGDGRARRRPGRLARAARRRSGARPISGA